MQKILSKTFSIDGGYAFAISVDEVTIFRSDKRNFVFFGNYSQYDSEKSAVAASSDMVARNRPFLRKLAQAASPEGVRIMIVDKYMASLEYFHSVYRDILADSNDDSYNNLHRTVPILNTLLEDTAGTGKQLDLVVNQMEMSVDGNYTAPEDGSVDIDAISHPDAITLLEIKEAMHDLLTVLKRDFSRFLQASSKAMKKNASFDPADMISEVASYYSSSACCACGMGESVIEGVKDVCGDLGLVCRGDSGNRVLVMIGTDLSYRGVMPLDGSIAPGSASHYHKMIRPAMEAIGHMRPVGEKVVIIPRQSLGTGLDSYTGFDVHTGSPSVIGINMIGGKKTKEPTFSYVISTPKSATSEKAMKNAESIKAASLVMVKKPESKYDGMAGTVDVSKMQFHNDHIEFPVSLEYDTGVKTELWLTDDDVIVYK